MKPEAILQADLLDIVFENRNKEYGAYTLRRGYNRRLLTALSGIPVLLLLFFILTTRPGDAAKQSASFFPAVDEGYKLKEVEIPKPAIPKPAVVPVQKKAAAIKNPTPVIVPDAVKMAPLPTVDELMKDNALIGLDNISGPVPEGIISPPGLPDGNNTTAVEMAGKENKGQTPVEKMPEFPGGLTALHRFLRKHLRVPQGVIEPGQRVRLPVRFVVNENGLLSDVEFLVQVDEAFQKEVLRVVNKMPRWQPGIRNGKPVPVYFLVPIIFDVPEQQAGTMSGKYAGSLKI